MKSLFYAKDASEHPAPQTVYNYRIYFLAVSAAMAAAMLGYDTESHELVHSYASG
jgi:hypothetical protein